MLTPIQNWSDANHKHNLGCRKGDFSGFATSHLPLGNSSPGMRWLETQLTHAAGQRVFDALINNVRAMPIFQPSMKLQPVFFESVGQNLAQTPGVWHYLVPEDAISSLWLPIGPHFPPHKEFALSARTLTTRIGEPFAPPESAQRILVRSPAGKTHSHSNWGQWAPECFFATT